MNRIETRQKVDQPQYCGHSIFVLENPGAKDIVVGCLLNEEFLGKHAERNHAQTQFLSHHHRLIVQTSIRHILLAYDAPQMEIV